MQPADEQERTLRGLPGDLGDTAGWADRGPVVRGLALANICDSPTDMKSRERAECEHDTKADTHGALVLGWAYLPNLVAGHLRLRAQSCVGRLLDRPSSEQVSTLQRIHSAPDHGPSPRTSHCKRHSVHPVPVQKT